MALHCPALYLEIAPFPQLVSYVNFHNFSNLSIRTKPASPWDLLYAPGHFGHVISFTMHHVLRLVSIFFYVSPLTTGFAVLVPPLQAADSATSSTRGSASAAAAPSLSTLTCSPSQLVDVTGSNAYQDPLPGQARRPCPAQNALANHGSLDRSGFTTLADCVAANKLVFNLSEDMSSFLCFQGFSLVRHIILQRNCILDLKNPVINALRHS